MKKINLLSLFVILIFVVGSCGEKSEDTPETGGNTESSDQEEVSSSDLNSFRVKYNVVGAVAEGNVTTIVKDKNFKTSVVFNVLGQSLETVIFGGEDTVYMMMDMGVVKENMKMSAKEFKEDESGDPTQIDFSNIDEILKKHNKLGTETILGKTCDVYDLGEGTIMVVYKDKVPMKIQNKEMTLVAVEYELNPDLPANEFDPPAGVEFKNAPDLN